MIKKYIFKYDLYYFAIKKITYDQLIEYTAPVRHSSWEI